MTLQLCGRPGSSPPCSDPSVQQEPPAENLPVHKEESHGLCSLTRALSSPRHGDTGTSLPEAMVRFTQAWYGGDARV